MNNFTPKASCQNRLTAILNFTKRSDEETSRLSLYALAKPLANQGRKVRHKSQEFGMNKKAAFTLSEVLITLVIVGVVAVLTIPIISANIRAKKLQSQFTKTYYELNQAARLFYQDNDMTVQEYEDILYDSTTTTPILRKFMSYFNGYTDSNYSAKEFDAKFGLENLNLNGEAISGRVCDRSNVMQDLSGRTYVIDEPPDKSGNTKNLKICVDINGKDKPNKWGVDKFVFVFTEDNRVIPYRGYHWNFNDVQWLDDTINKRFCTTAISNPVHTCAYFALKNVSPEGNGDYWHDFLRGK
jgi:prepilin-type N-terminal cleavage/methylation domain-containing protein